LIGGCWLAIGLIYFIVLTLVLGKPARLSAPQK
jgi:hypothetical protein